MDFNHKLWQQCCDKEGVAFAKKGTDVYQRVLDQYRTISHTPSYQAILLKRNEKNEEFRKQIEQRTKEQKARQEWQKKKSIESMSWGT